MEWLSHTQKWSMRAITSPVEAQYLLLKHNNQQGATVNMAAVNMGENTLTVKRQ